MVRPSFCRSVVNHLQCRVTGERPEEGSSGASCRNAAPLHHPRPSNIYTVSKHTPHQVLNPLAGPGPLDPVDPPAGAAAPLHHAGQVPGPLPAPPRPPRSHPRSLGPPARGATPPPGRPRPLPAGCSPGHLPRGPCPGAILAPQSILSAAAECQAHGHGKTQDRWCLV